MVYTKENESIAAFYRHENSTYRVLDYVNDFCIQKADGSSSQWYSTHAALTLRADIQMALTSYLGFKVLQKDIDLTL